MRKQKITLGTKGILARRGHPLYGATVTVCGLVKNPPGLVLVRATKRCFASIPVEWLVLPLPEWPVLPLPEF